MLQFIDNIKSTKGFVDLHIHTNDSYGDEMDMMNLSPEELLESIYQYTLKNGKCPVTFAVTDHSSIEAVAKIKKIINSDKQKYAHIKFISGCEFSCSGGSLGTFINSQGFRKNIVKNFHVLAYNFDENNEDMQFITKLYSTRRNNMILCNNIYFSAGLFVVATQNILKDHEIILPITAFKDISLDTSNETIYSFVDKILNFCDKLDVDKTILDDIKTQLLNRNILHLGKIDCMEFMEIVESAGGYCVLAHPYLIKISSWAKKSITTFENFLENMIIEHKIKVGKYDYNNDKFLKYMIYKLRYKAVSPITGKKLHGIVGIEALHSTNFDRPFCLPNLLKIAKEYNLFLSCGSDSHGSLIKGSILSRFLNANSCDDYNYNNVVVTNCALANALLNKTVDQNCSLSFDEQFRIEKFTDKKIVRLNFKALNKEVVYIKSKKKVKKISENVDKSKSEKDSLEILSTAIKIGKENLNKMIATLKDLIENDYEPKVAMAKYQELSTYTKEILFVIRGFKRNKTIIENDLDAKEFLDLFKENKKLAKIFKRKYESIYFSNSKKDYENED